MRVVSTTTSLIGVAIALGGGLGANATPIPSPNPSALDTPRFDSPGNVKSPRPFDNPSFPGRNKVVRQRHPAGRKSSDSFKGLGLAPGRQPAAAPMSRSLARDAGSQEVNAQGLGVIDPSQAESIRKSIHDLAVKLATLGPAGPAMVDMVNAIGDAVVDMLVPNTPASKRAISHFMPRQSSSDPSAGDTLNAEGLGLLPAASGQQITATFDDLSKLLETTVPVLGPIVGGLVGTVGNLLGGLVSRDVGEQDCPDEDGMQRRGFESFIPPPIYQSASSYLGQGQTAAQGTPAGPTLQEYVGPDGRVYEAFGSGSGVPQSFDQFHNIIGELSEPSRSLTGAAQGYSPSSFPSTVGGFPSPFQNIAAGSPAGAASQYISSAQNAAGSTGAGTATQFVSSVQDGGLSAESISGGPGELIGYLSNGLPIFAPLQGPLQGVPGTIGGLTNTVGGAVGGVLSNSPVGGLVNGVVGNSPLSGVLGTVGGLPIVGDVLGKAGAQGGGGLFGILDTSPSDTASSSTVMATATATSTSTDSSTASPMPTTSSYPQSAEGKDPTDDNDPSTLGAQDSGSDDASMTSASMTPYGTATSTWGPSDGASSTPAATMSTGAHSTTMAEGTPTPSLPPQ